MIELAREVIAIANEGLKARCIPSSNLKFPDETHFLDALKEVVESERTAADKLIELYRKIGTRMFPKYSITIVTNITCVQLKLIGMHSNKTSIAKHANINPNPNGFKLPFQLLFTI